MRAPVARASVKAPANVNAARSVPINKFKSLS